MGLKLTRDDWKKFKTDNTLSKSSFFNKADVGPTIDKFQKARDAFKSAKTKKNFDSLFNKAIELQKAFEKFVKIKESKEELSNTAKAQIQEWHSGLQKTIVKLAKKHEEEEEELLENDAKEVWDILGGTFG